MTQYAFVIQKAYLVSKVIVWSRHTCVQTLQVATSLQCVPESAYLRYVCFVHMSVYIACLCEKNNNKSDVWCAVFLLQSIPYTVGMKSRNIYYFPFMGVNFCISLNGLY